MRAALEGDNTKVIAHLDKLNEFFHQAIQQNRNISADSEVFDAAMYFAKDAIRLGLADSIGTLDNAVNIAFDYAQANSIMKNYKNQ